MSVSSREEIFTLGAKTYALRTVLDKAQFEELQNFSQNLFAKTDANGSQEKRLLQGWMLMAYKLQQIERRLKEFDGLWGNAERLSQDGVSDDRKTEE